MGELIRKFASTIFDTFQSAHWALKTAAIVVLCAVLMFGGRCGAFGSATERILWEYLPWETPLDCAQPTLRANLAFAVLQGGAYVTGRQATAYPSGTQIRLTATASDPCWMTLFGIDAEGWHPIFPSRDRNEVARFDPDDGALTEEFVIDTTRGPEVYVLVTALRRFDFSVIERASASAGDALARGPDFASRLNLPTGFAYDDVYLENLGKPGP